MKNFKKISDKRKKLLTVLSVIFIVTAVSIFTENIFKISGQAVPNPGHSLGDILIDQDLDMGAHCIGLGGVTECSWPGGAGTIDGGGTANYIPKWTGLTTLDNSIIIENAAGNIGIGTNAPAHKLDVTGSIYAVNNTGHAIMGSSDFTGVYGVSATGGAGVSGSSNSGYGVSGVSASGYSGYFSGGLGIKVGGDAALGGAEGDKVKAYEYCDEAGTNCHDASGGWGAIPSGFCIFSDTVNACPMGWTRRASFDGKTIKGNAAPGGTGGADTHTHTVSVGLAAWRGTWANDDTAKSGTYTTSAGDSWPPYMEVIVCCKN